MFTSSTLILPIFAIVTILLIFYLLRRSLLHIHYALWWCFGAVCVFFMGLFLEIFNEIESFWGIDHYSIFFVTLVFSIVLIRLLLADMERTQLKIQIKRLMQQQANLLYRMKKVEQIVKKEEEK